MKKIDNKILFLSLFLGIILYLGFNSPLRADEEMRAFPADPVPQIVKAVPIDHDFTFVGERVPLENFDALERLDRELIINTYRHSSTLQILKNSKRYFPLIERIFKEQGIPEDFKYLLVAESAFQNATSSAGAKGFWQFMKSAAKEMGLEVNKEIDERYNIEKSTLAACKYIRQNFNRFGNWTLAAAAYNIGPTKLKSELKNQEESSFYNLNLNSETSRYLFRILAFKEILSNPEKFGYYLSPQDFYQPLDQYYLVEVDTTIPSLAKFAHEHGTTYRMLKIYNPWLKSSRLPDKSRRKYYIKIPK